MKTSTPSAQHVWHGCASALGRALFPPAILLQGLPGFNGVVEKRASDHGLTMAPQRTGLQNNPVSMCRWIGIREAADLSLLGVLQPSDSALRCMAINKWEALVCHADTMAKPPCGCWAI